MMLLTYQPADSCRCQYVQYIGTSVPKLVFLPLLYLYFIILLLSISSTCYALICTLFVHLYILFQSSVCSAVDNNVIPPGIIKFSVFLLLFYPNSYHSFLFFYSSSSVRPALTNCSPTSSYVLLQIDYFLLQPIIIDPSQKHGFPLFPYVNISIQ